MLVNVLKMASLHHPDLINHIGLDFGRLIADLDQSAHPNCRADGVDSLFCISVPQDKYIAREEGNGPHLYLPMTNGLLSKHRAIGRHALLLEVLHGQGLTLRLGLHHPPGLINRLFRRLKVDNIPLE